VIHYKPCETEAELIGILALQQRNLVAALSDEEQNSQGFLTVKHTQGDLRAMNAIEPHIVALDKTSNGEQVAGYLLAMTADSRFRIPILVPMFEAFSSIVFRGKPVSESRYIVVGQACVDKAYRGQGVLDACYKTYRETFSPRYDFAITEIASTNTRSLAAHKRIGFQEVFTAPSESNAEWRMVIWDWQ
jgi:ribosomal protein S18 acetylase RimI-like enzyme